MAEAGDPSFLLPFVVEPSGLSVQKQCGSGVGASMRPARLQPTLQNGTAPVLLRTPGHAKNREIRFSLFVCQIFGDSLQIPAASALPPAVAARRPSVQTRGPSLDRGGVMYAVFLGSYTVILQPVFPPPKVERETEQPDGVNCSAYILRRENGQLEYYVEGTLMQMLTPEMLSQPPYADMLIVDEAIEEVRPGPIWGS